MRILGFSKKWDKLKQDTFTTFRFTRRDRDWEVGEVVQVVYKTRAKEREVLGVAKIISKEARSMWREYPLENVTVVSDSEILADGFNSYNEIWKFLLSKYGYRDDIRVVNQPMNKLTLRWDIKGEL